MRNSPAPARAGCSSRSAAGVEFFADEEELGPWQTIYYRYNRWRKEGLWQQRYAKRFGASGEALDSRFEARVSL